ncbi:MAG: CvpA family protein [Candidatus Marinimicrobia bacterium]|nr:CvpA family protein [Candidatus Neomarinimicrobiota bacterium]MCH8011250.1 CvpA family protein [Candidatus Neomarinimicrobiota bacterium]
MSHPFDIFAYLFITILSIVGYKRGFLEEISRIIGICLSFFIAKSLISIIVERLQPFTYVDPRLIAFLSFLTLFLIFIIVIRLITNAIQGFLLATGIRMVNRFLGLAFGTLKGILAIIVIVWLADILPYPNYFNNFKNHSTFYQSYSGYRKMIIRSMALEELVVQNEFWIRVKLDNKKVQYF